MKHWIFVVALMTIGVNFGAAHGVYYIEHPLASPPLTMYKTATLNTDGGVASLGADVRVYVKHDATVLADSGDINVPDQSIDWSHSFPAPSGEWAGTTKVWLYLHNHWHALGSMRGLCRVDT